MTPAEDWLPPGFTELQTISWQSNNPSYGYRNRPLPLYPGLPGSRRTMRFGISCLLSCGANRLVPRFFPTGASICIAGRSVPLERLRTRRSLGLRVSLFAEHLATRRTACLNGYPRAGIRPIRPASEGCNPLCTEVRRVRFSFQGAGSMIVARCGICRRTALESPQDFKVHRISTACWPSPSRENLHSNHS